MTASADPLRGNPYADLDGMPQEWRKLTKTFLIPVSGGVRLYGPEVLLVDTPEFQRLDGIKQLGTSYLVFRGARHTRYEHSLGTLHRGEQMIQALLDNPRPDSDVQRVTSTARRVARLACLLHDLPHVPFGHTLEDEFGLLQRHDENAPRIRRLLKGGNIGRILRKSLPPEEYRLLLQVLSTKDDDVTKVSLGDHHYGFVVDIVGNTLCADLLDYVPRDLGACGMVAAVGDHFLSYLTITGPDEPGEAHRNRLALKIDKRGMPRPDVESEVIKLLTHRYELAERVYFHHAKNAGSVMLGRAVVDAGLLELGATGPADATWDENFWWLSDDLLIEALIHPSEIASALNLRLAQRSPQELQRAAQLGAAVKERRLFKPVYLGVYDDLEHRAVALYESYGTTPHSRFALENQLAAQAGCDEGDVLIHLPRPQMMTKSAQVRVLLSDSTVHTLETWDDWHGGRVQALNTAHRRLWRLAVYLHPSKERSPSTVALLQAAAEECFGAPSRLRARPRQTYREAVWDHFVQVRGSNWDARYQEQVVSAPAAYAPKANLETVGAEMREQVAELKRQARRRARRPKA